MTENLQLHLADEGNRLKTATKLWERFCQDFGSGDAGKAYTRFIAGIQIAIRTGYQQGLSDGQSHDE